MCTDGFVVFMLALLNTKYLMLELNIAIVFTGLIFVYVNC